MIMKKKSPDPLPIPLRSILYAAVLLILVVSPAWVERASSAVGQPTPESEHQIKLLAMQEEEVRVQREMQRLEQDRLRVRLQLDEEMMQKQLETMRQEMESLAAAGKKSDGTLTLAVEGAHAPLMQHLAPLITERVNRFFGYPAIGKIAFHQGRQLRTAPKVDRPRSAPVPKELGEGLRQIADPELRACLESLAGKLAGSRGGPSIEPEPTKDIPVIFRSK